MSARRDLLAGLYPVTRALRRIEDDAAAAEDLTMWQYAILSVVGEVPGLNQGEIAQRLQYSANRIIADLDRLESRGLVVRRLGEDRRSNVIASTRSGAAVQRRVQRAIHAAEDRLLAGLSVTQQRQLHTILGSLERDVAGNDAYRSDSAMPSRMSCSLAMTASAPARSTRVRSTSAPPR